MSELNENKISYTHSAVYKAKDAALDTAVMVVEGFAKRLFIQTVSVNGEMKKVATLTVSAVQPETRVKFLFGDEFVDSQYHSVRYEVAFWGKVAENLEKYPPQKNQKVTMMMTRMKKDSYTKKDTGETFLSVKATGIDFPWTSSAKKESGTPVDTRYGENTKPQGNEAQATPAAAQAYQTVPDGRNQFAEFSEYDDISDDDLPF